MGSIKKTNSVKNPKKMKVGIITYHRAHNYGAVLQCYALQEIIKELGHDVTIIDYKQPFIEKLYNPSKYIQIRKQIFHPRNLWRLKSKFKNQDLQACIFRDFRDQYLNVSAPCMDNNIPNFDCYIIGSDQMWSIDCVGNHIDPVYFGDFKRQLGSKLIGFSISSNESSIRQIKKDLLKYSRLFDNISFREHSVASQVNKVLSSNFPVTLDPTLCAKPDIWDDLFDEKWSARKYLVLYHVKLRFSPIVYKLLMKQANRISKFHDLEVIDLSDGTYSVKDFISIIKFSKYVLTSSFHATVFSIIFNKPLFSVKLHDGHDERYVDLLHCLNADDFLVDLDFKDTTPRDVDFNLINNNLKIYRQPSIEYLKSNII